MKTIVVGERGTKYMPYSEVCMHMKVSGKVMEFELISERSVQLYREDGTMFSFPITYGEAGVFRSDEGYYYYPDDSKDPASPSIEEIVS
jgi:hypothetical protein